MVPTTKKKMKLTKRRQKKDKEEDNEDTEGDDDDEDNNGNDDDVVHPGSLPFVLSSTPPDRVRIRVEDERFDYWQDGWEQNYRAFQRFQGGNQI
jgi:hypothetical protein